MGVPILLRAGIAKQDAGLARSTLWRMVYAEELPHTFTEELGNHRDERCEQYEPTGTYPVDSTFAYLPEAVATNQAGLPSLSRPSCAPATGGSPPSKFLVCWALVPPGKNPLSRISSTASLKMDTIL